MISKLKNVKVIKQNLRKEKRKEIIILIFDYKKLKGRMIEKFGSQGEFAKIFGCSKNTLSLKLNNKIRFTTNDIVTIVDLLNIPKHEIGEYFFTILVKKS